MGQGGGTLRRPAGGEEQPPAQPDNGSPPAEGVPSVAPLPETGPSPTRRNSGFSLRKSSGGLKERKGSGPSRGSLLTTMRLRQSAGGGTVGGGSADEWRRRVDEAFERYRAVAEEEEDEEELDADTMGPNGMAALLGDLGVAEDDVLAFVVAWKLGAARVSRVSRAEFQAGLQGLKCDSVAAVRALLPRLEEELKAHRRDVALYAFKISRPPNAKTLDLASARILIELFLPPSQHQHTAPFVAWLLSPQQTSYRSLNLDQFSQLYDFSHAGIRADLSNFDDDDGWPCLIDEYVEHVRREQSEGPQRLADGVSGSP